MEFILVNPMNDSTLIANRNNLFPDEEQKGQHTTMVRILASRPSCPCFESMCSQKNFRAKIVDVAEVNQWRCLEESGKWLENVDRTHLVLASGKLVLQKNFVRPI